MASTHLRTASDEPLPLVDVSVNGSGPWTFLVDTGATAVTVSADLADGSGLARGQVVGHGTSGLGDFTFTSAHLDSLVAADRELGPLTVQVEDLARLCEVAGEDVHGILGHAAFAELVLALDYPGETLSLLDRCPSPVGDPITFRHGPAGPRVLLVDGTLEGRGGLEFIVDTGSSVVLVAERTAREIGLDLVRDLRPGYPDDFDHWWTNLGAVGVGATIRTDVEAIVYDVSRYDELIGVAVDGVLGQPFLRHGTLVVDYPRRVLHLSTEPAVGGTIAGQGR